MREMDVVIIHQRMLDNGLSGKQEGTIIQIRQTP